MAARLRIGRSGSGRWFDEERVRRRLGDDDGAAGALEYALVVPIFLVLAFMVVQAGLYWEAHNVLNAVADQTGRVTRTHASYPGIPADAMPSVAQLDATAVGAEPRALAALDPGKMASGVRVDSVTVPDPAQRTITVTVSGAPLSILGFGLPRIAASVTGAYEGYVPVAAGVGGP